MYKYLHNCVYCKSRDRRHKELMKAIETPEEKRARRLKKKEEKERHLRSKMGWDQEMMVTMDMN